MGLGHVLAYPSPTVFSWGGRELNPRANVANYVKIPKKALGQRTLPQAVKKPDISEIPAVPERDRHLPPGV